jgi:hypothetical protein
MANRFTKLPACENAEYFIGYARILFTKLLFFRPRAAFQ